MDGEIDRLLRRTTALEDAAAFPRDATATASPTLLCTTATLLTYPAAARVFYAVQPLRLLGNEVEGGAGATASANAVFFALNIGNAVPPNGTQVVCTYVGNRWVFNYSS